MASDTNYHFKWHLSLKTLRMKKSLLPKKTFLSESAIFKNQLESVERGKRKNNLAN